MMETFCRDEDLAVFEAAKTFADRELAPHAGEIDETATFAGRHIPGSA
jgi:hypothetical protein